MKENQVRANFNIDAELWQQFQDICKLKLSNATEILTEFIEETVNNDLDNVKKLPTNIDFIKQTVKQELMLYVHKELREIKEEISTINLREKGIDNKKYQEEIHKNISKHATDDEIAKEFNIKIKTVRNYRRQNKVPRKIADKYKVSETNLEWIIKD